MIKLDCVLQSADKTVSEKMFCYAMGNAINQVKNQIENHVWWHGAGFVRNRIWCQIRKDIKND